MDETFISPPESLIALAEWQQTPASVQRWVIDLCAKNNQLRETVEVLQELIHRNSQNSSQPPSQDRPEQKRAREVSGPPRQRGGQPGHAGHHRALVKDVDEVVVSVQTNWGGRADCTPQGTVQDPVRLSGDSGIITCTLRNPGGPAFMSPIDVQIDYGYTKNIWKDLRIENPNLRD